jgi:predicted GNAT family acetyltransferase
MTSRATANPEVVDNEAEHQYEIWKDGRRAGLAAYRLGRGEITIVHTEIDDAFEGQGLGGQLAKATLDDSRARGLAVVPVCPFFGGYIKRHLEYLDLVPAAERDRVPN